MFLDKRCVLNRNISDNESIMTTSLIEVGNLPRSVPLDRRLTYPTISCEVLSRATQAMITILTLAFGGKLVGIFLRLSPVELSFSILRTPGLRYL